MRRFAAPLRLATLASAPPRSGAPSSKCNPCGDHQVLPMRCPDSESRPTVGSNPQSAIRNPQSSFGSTEGMCSPHGLHRVITAWVTLFGTNALEKEL